VRSGSNLLERTWTRWTIVTRAPARTATWANSKGHVATTNEDDRRGKRFQVEEIVADRDVLRAVDRKGTWHSTSGNRDRSRRLERLAIDR
jgi:hypothetical protein